MVRRRLRLHAIGVAIAPLSLVFLVAAQFVNVSIPAQQVPRGLLALHVTANLVGVGLFLLAGAAAVFYLIEERRLFARGIGLVDASLLASCLLTLGTRLWTRDRRLHAAALELGVGTEVA